MPEREGGSGGLAEAFAEGPGGSNSMEDQGEPKASADGPGSSISMVACTPEGRVSARVSHADALEAALDALDAMEEATETGPTDTKAPEAAETGAADAKVPEAAETGAADAKVPEAAETGAADAKVPEAAETGAADAKVPEAAETGAADAKVPEEELVECPSSPAAAPAETAFHLKPSVSTWLRPRFLARRKVAVRPERVQVPFCLKPSVGTWLLSLPPSEALEKSCGAGAQLADSVFEESCGAGSKLADSAAAAGEDAFAKALAGEAQPEGQLSKAGKLARARTAVMPAEPEEASAKEEAPAMTRMRTAVLPPGEKEEEEGERAEETPSMTRMRTAVLPPGEKEEAHAEEKEEKEEKEEEQERTEDRPSMARMRTAVLSPSEKQESPSEKEQDAPKAGEPTVRPIAPGRGPSMAEELTEEVVASGAGQKGVALARQSPPPREAEAPVPPSAVPTPPFEPPHRSSPTPVGPPTASAQKSSMKDVDHMVTDSLDRFFSDEINWKKVGREIATSTKGPVMRQRPGNGQCTFRIQVPRPYPGVQYRRSKCLDDRWARFAENGSTISGKVEDGGEWLKVGEQIYLPMRVGAVRIMEPLPPGDVQASPSSAPQRSPTESWWNLWACCSGEKSSASESAEVVVNPGGDDGWQQHRPPLGRGSSSPRLGGAGAGAGAPAAAGAGAFGPPTASGGVAAKTGPSAGAGGAALRAPAAQSAPEDADPPRPRPLPEDVSRNPLSNLDAANRHFSHPINPFSDTAAAGSASPGKRRTEGRYAEDLRQPDPIKDVFQA